MVKVVMNLSGIDLNLLKVLDALITERNVTRAGLRLGRTQPAVSNALHRLRTLLGDELLVRSPGGLMLTSRAETLRKPLRDAIALLESCLTDEPEFDPAKASGTFRVSMPDGLGIAILPPLVIRLQKLAPRLAVQVLTSDREHALNHLEGNRIDLAIGWLDTKASHFSSQLLGEEKLHCVFRRNHPILKRRGKFDINTVLSYPHLVVTSSGRTMAIFDELLVARKLKRNSTVIVTNFAVVPQLLDQSDMIGVYPKLAADVLQSSSKLVRRPVPIDVGGLAMKMVWHIRHDRDQRHAWLRQEIKSLDSDLRHTSNRMA
jgi:DNA-binding transcriptional LysR family regulator